MRTLQFNGTGYSTIEHKDIEIHVPFDTSQAVLIPLDDNTAVACLDIKSARRAIDRYRETGYWVPLH